VEAPPGRPGGAVVRLVTTPPDGSHPWVARLTDQRIAREPSRGPAVSQQHMSRALVPGSRQ